jgi:2,5-furandicarboxylate decarboxylase 1
MAKNLRTFLREALERNPAAVKTVDVPVDRKFGITAYAAKLAERGEYPGLLFTNVIGAKYPVVANAMAAYDRMALALGCAIEELPQVYGTRVRKPIAPTVVHRDAAPVKEVVLRGDEVDLRTLPIPWHNELDGGAYVTGGALLLRDPESGSINAGIYRHQVWNEREMGVWFFGSHHGGLILDRYAERDEPVPFALVI